MADETQFADVELLVKVDAHGQWEVGSDADDLGKRWLENVSDEPDADPARVVRVKLRIPLPRVVEVCGTVPEERADGCELRVA